MNMRVQKLTKMAVLTCIALVMFTVELQIPPLLPVPGVKPGLANLVTLLILFLGCGWKTKDAVLVLIARILLAAWVTGQPTALLYSFAGGMAAIAAMRGMKTVLNWVVASSIAGALAHILAQLAVASLMLSPSVFVYLPVYIISGVISGLFTGLLISFLFRTCPSLIQFLRKER